MIIMVCYIYQKMLTRSCPGTGLDKPTSVQVRHCACSLATKRAIMPVQVVVSERLVTQQDNS